MQRQNKQVEEDQTLQAIHVLLRAIGNLLYSSMDRSVRQQWEQSVADAGRLDGHMFNRSVADMEVHTPPELQEPEPKRLRPAPSEGQQIGGQNFPPSLPAPPDQQSNTNAPVEWLGINIQSILYLHANQS